MFPIRAIKWNRGGGNLRVRCDRGLCISLHRAVIRRLPALLADGLVNLARFFGGLGAVAGTEGKSLPLAEKLELHRPGANLDSFAFVRECVFEQSLAPVSRLPFGRRRRTSWTFLEHFTFLTQTEMVGNRGLFSGCGCFALMRFSTGASGFEVPGSPWVSRLRQSRESSFRFTEFTFSQKVGSECWRTRAWH